MRIIFMGTPEFAVPTLTALREAGHEIVAVYTQPPRRAGRGKKLRISPVHAAAQALDLEVRCPPSLEDEDEQAIFAGYQADAAVVAAYGLILPRKLLDAPERGCLNVHASLLPRWRGAAPVQRAILAGDRETGVSIMQMEPGLDTGPVLARRATPIGAMNGGELTAELAELGAELMVEVLETLDEIAPEHQDDALATYAAKIDKAETRIDWNSSAQAIERQIRAFAPSPCAWFELEGERIRIHAAEAVDARGAPGTVLDDRLTIACGEGAIRPTIVQRAGKPAMAAQDMLRGKPVAPGTVLS